jgi:hypothetical protein
LTGSRSTPGGRWPASGSGGSGRSRRPPPGRARSTGCRLRIGPLRADLS